MATNSFVVVLPWAVFLPLGLCLATRFIRLTLGRRLPGNLTYLGGDGLGRKGPERHLAEDIGGQPLVRLLQPGRRLPVGGASSRTNFGGPVGHEAKQVPHIPQGLDALELAAGE